jgi:hypothetical protein
MGTFTAAFALPPTPPSLILLRLSSPTCVAVLSVGWFVM